MKKISVILLMIILFLSLTGCQLAVTDGNDTSTNSEHLWEEDLGYIPVRFNYSIYDFETGELIDVSEYIYYTWLLSDSLNDEYLITTCDYGLSMEAIVCSTDINIVENEDGIESKETTEIFEANIYISRALEGTPLYPTITLLNYQDEEKTSESYGVAMQEGLTSTSSFETVFPDGEVFNLSIKLHHIILDDLQTIEINEYDDQDHLINTTFITEETLLDELTLQEETDFIFIIETYLDESGESYTERLYYYGEQNVYYKYKYFNEDGFLYLGYLHIAFPA